MLGLLVGGLGGHGAGRAVAASGRGAGSGFLSGYPNVVTDSVQHVLFLLSMFTRALPAVRGRVTFLGARRVEKREAGQRSPSWI
jgi:hypothetical protein